MQPKDKNDSVQLSSRYLQYTYAKRHLRGECRPEIFSVGQTDGICAESNEAQKGVYDIASTMTARQYASWGGNFLQEVTKGMSQGYRVYDPQGLSTTLAGEAGGVGAKTGLYAMRWERTEKGKQARREAQSKGKDYTPFGDGHRQLTPIPGKPIGALTAQAIAKDSLVGNFMSIRRLTPVECERLQGFPDNFTSDLSDTQRYKCLGNAVTTNVIEYIGRQLVKFIE